MAASSAAHYADDLKTDDEREEDDQEVARAWSMAGDAPPGLDITAWGLRATFAESRSARGPARRVRQRFQIPAQRHHQPLTELFARITERVKELDLEGSGPGKLSAPALVEKGKGNQGQGDTQLEIMNKMALDAMGQHIPARVQRRSNSPGSWKACRMTSSSRIARTLTTGQRSSS